jgi:hypothetical protein
MSAHFYAVLQHIKRFLTPSVSDTFGGSDFSDSPTLPLTGGSIEVNDDFP